MQSDRNSLRGCRCTAYTWHTGMKTASKTYSTLQQNLIKLGFSATLTLSCSFVELYKIKIIIIKIRLVLLSIHLVWNVVFVPKCLVKVGQPLRENYSHLISLHCLCIIYIHVAYGADLLYYAILYKILFLALKDTFNRIFELFSFDIYLYYFKYFKILQKNCSVREKMLNIFRKGRKFYKFIQEKLKKSKAKV